MKRTSSGTWIVPRLWPDGECFILGGGPSLANVDVGRLKGRRVIAVNQAFRLGAWIDVLFFGDCRWWNANQADLLKFAGLKVTTCIQHVDKPGIKVVKRRNSPQGLSFDPGTLAWNLSSGACAINLAVHLGVKRIVLLGFDMRKVEERHNWHDLYQKPSNPRRNPYPRFLKPFPHIAEALRRKHIECVNACPGSGLTEFPVVDPEEVLC
jgi:hypothetical protein